MSDLPNYSQPLLDHFTTKMEGLSAKLRDLQVLKIIPEKLTLPKIIVVGDKYAGKTMLIRSLTNVNVFPQQQFPLILKFQNNPSCSSPKYYLKYKDCSMEVERRFLIFELNSATHNLGQQLGLKFEDFHASKTCTELVTLVVEQAGVPEMTILDLPAISTRLGEHEKVEDLEAIKGLIMEHTGNKNCVYIDVISACGDIVSSRSTQLLMQLDPTKSRTITAITKCDLANENSKVNITTTKFKHTSAYVYVSNFDANFQKSKDMEIETFNKLLYSSLPKSCVGRDSLANHVVLFMLFTMFNSSSPIVVNIDKDLRVSEEEKTTTAEKFETIDQAIIPFLSIVKSSEKSLEKLFISKDYQKYKNDIHMHSAARIIERMKNFLHILKEQNEGKNKPFLIEEIELINERKWNSSSLIPTSVFNSLLEKRIEGSRFITETFVSDMWEYIEHVVLKVLIDNSQNHPQLKLAVKRTARKMIERERDSFSKKVSEMMEIQKMYLWTCDPSFLSSWEKMKLSKCDLTSISVDGCEHKVVNVPGMGSINLEHLKSVPESCWHVAFDLKTTLIAYWDIVAKRTVDYINLNLMHSLKQMTNGVMERVMLAEFKDKENKVELLLKEQPGLSVYRENLERRTKLLHEVKEDIQKLQDEFAFLVE